MKSLQKLLVANRGEIALRIMRTARDMGIQTVAVYSEADANSPHVRFADEAICIGPPESAKSYLRSRYLVELALSYNCDAIHPGYGFLSENAAFATEVHQAGLLFVGPPPKAIELMGSKLAAKAAVKKNGVPLVPGLDSAIDDIEKAKKVAQDIGFPVLIKASAGGGGKGMRLVERAEEFEAQMQRAVSEAKSAFGDGSVFVEKFVNKPRHIEIQVLADSHGNVVHLFERECSIQRRHQKVIEEAPSSLLTPEVRRKMGEAAINVAKACGYVNAGTVEFIVDDKQNFYFLEMNTRLQVEHPVTEMVTGLDLVREQLRIARGEKLGYSQDSLQLKGHSIQVRVYAEDPADNFLPAIGKLTEYREPTGPGIRVDSGVEENLDVPIYYDPMLAKLIVHAEDRPQAIEKMRAAIRDYRIVGCETTLSFGDYVMRHPAFRSGRFTTGFVKEHYQPEKLHEALTEEEVAAAAVAADLFFDELTADDTAPQQVAQPVRSAWRVNRG